MGAFVSAATAARHPDLFSSVLLVDGGIGFPVPQDADPDELLTAVIGSAMQRLARAESPIRRAGRWSRRRGTTRAPVS